MPDKYDRYREALVVETQTVWPDDCDLAATRREEIERQLHANAAECAHLEYIRVHTGFCRKVRVTDADIERYS